MADSQAPAFPPPPGEVAMVGHPPGDLHTLNLVVTVALLCLITVSASNCISVDRRGKVH